LKKKGSYYKVKYYQLKSRRGAKKAIVAIAHRILKAVYYIIKYGKTFNDLGEDYLRRKNRVKNFNRLKKTARQFGFYLLRIEDWILSGRWVQGIVLLRLPRFSALPTQSSPS